MNNMKTKPVYNYDLEQCNALFKKGVFPIGIGTNNKTGTFMLYLKLMQNILIRSN